MNIPIFIILLFGLQISCLLIGKKTSKKLSTTDDYFLAKQRIGLFPLMMTFLATQVGGGFILGSAEEAYLFGWKVLFYPLGASLGLIFLGTFFGKKLAALQVSTVAQIFETVYRSKILQKGASMISVFSLFIILIAQMIASHKFMISIGVQNEIGFILFWAIVIVYTAVGGFRAVVATDILQSIFLVGVLLGSFIYMLCFNQTVNSQDMVFSFESLSGSKLYSWLALPFLFMFIEQDMAQRCFAGKSNRTLQWSAVYSGIGAFLLSLIPIFFGVMAKSQGIAISERESVFMSLCFKIGPYFSSFIAVAILSAIVSTADSLINAIGSNLSQDFQYTKRQSLRSSQKISIGIATLALVLSFFFQNILQLLMISYELSVSCLLVPIIAAVFKRRQSSLSAYLSVLLGATGFFVFRWTKLFLPKEILSLVLSFIGHQIGSIITKKMGAPVLEEINP